MKTLTTIIPRQQWQDEARTHRATVETITRPMRERKSRHVKHPVYDFLHTYYSFSLGRLEKWHPGVGVTLEDDPDWDFPTRSYRRKSGKAWIDPALLEEKGRQRLLWVRQLLSLTQQRSPHFACHGLHEWAMVYRGGDIRHRESAPLRLPQDQIDSLVENRPINCSHFDAFRFFAPGAQRFNKLSPTLLTREHHEQPGCIHANMDLYKWAYKCSPWIPSSLLRKTLFFAIEAREVDMRASPYDLAEWSYQPIRVETPEGRREYEQAQLELYRKGLTLRQSLIDSLAWLGS